MKISGRLLQANPSSDGKQIDLLFPMPESDVLTVATSTADAEHAIGLLLSAYEGCRQISEGKSEIEKGDWVFRFARRTGPAGIAFAPIERSLTLSFSVGGGRHVAFRLSEEDARFTAEKMLAALRESGPIGRA